MKTRRPKSDAWWQLLVPAVLSLHANIVNANGKAYSVDRIFRLVP